jgi:hypothetical protein
MVFEERPAALSLCDEPAEGTKLLGEIPRTIMTEIVNVERRAVFLGRCLGNDTSRSLVSSRRPSCTLLSEQSYAISTQRGLCLPR